MWGFFSLHYFFVTVSILPVKIYNKIPPTGLTLVSVCAPLPLVDDVISSSGE